MPEYRLASDFHHGLGSNGRFLSQSCAESSRQNDHAHRNVHARLSVEVKIDYSTILILKHVNSTCAIVPNPIDVALYLRIRLRTKATTRQTIALAFARQL